MMAQSRAESTRDTYNYGLYLNQFPPNMIKVIREFEQIQKKICRHKMSIMFNEICIYKYIYIYIYWEREKIIGDIEILPYTPDIFSLQFFLIFNEIDNNEMQRIFRIVSFIYMHMYTDTDKQRNWHKAHTHTINPKV